VVRAPQLTVILKQMKPPVMTNPLFNAASYRFILKGVVQPKMKIRSFTHPQFHGNTKDDNLENVSTVFVHTVKVRGLHLTFFS